VCVYVSKHLLCVCVSTLVCVCKHPCVCVQSALAVFGKMDGVTEGERSMLRAVVDSEALAAMPSNTKVSAPGLAAAQRKPKKR